VNEVDQENKTVRLTSYDLPVPDPEGIRLREEQLQAKEEAEQANREMGDEAKLAELAAVLDNDEETMTQIKKMIDSYGNDVEFVNLKVSNLSILCIECFVVRNLALEGINHSLCHAFTSLHIVCPNCSPRMTRLNEL
jgi:hypothetical protein